MAIRLWEKRDSRWLAIGFVLVGAATMLVLGSWSAERASSEQATYDAAWRRFIEDVATSREQPTIRVVDGITVTTDEQGEDPTCEWIQESLAGRVPAIVLTPGGSFVPLGDWKPPSDDVAREYLRRLC